MAEARVTQRRRISGVWVVPIVAVVAVLLAVSVVVLNRFSSVPEPSTPASLEPGVSAAELVDRAREYFDLHREQDNERAIKLLQQALEGNPDDPLALAGLSLAFSQRSAKFNQPVEWAGEAEGLARQAIAKATA